MNLTHGTSPADGDLALLVGTRKGAFILRSDTKRENWRMEGPQFLGHIVYHMVLDPRDRETLLMASSTGHLGPTLHRSFDFGKSWEEVKGPPAFPKSEDGTGRTVSHTFWLTPGHASEPDVWYAGTSPQALFRSDDNGNTWSSVSGFNDHPMYKTWIGDEQDGTPDGPILHSILVDPRDANHLYVGLSGGGCFESTDRGATWDPLNKGCFVDFGPEPYPEYGQDPHNIELHAHAPDILYQQNHCGIYRMDRREGEWVRIGDNMPKDIGDIGFPMTLHPRDPDTAWVFPMDGSDVWPRVSPDGKPAVYKTSDAGQSWVRQDGGLPSEQGWLTVLRQCMCSDEHDPLGLYFGTTSGEIWASNDEGNSWTQIAAHLPKIYSIEAVELAP